MSIKYNYIYNGVIWTMVLCTLIVKVYFLNKGLILSDDGWLCFLQRDCPSGLGTSFAYFFRHFPRRGDILVTRWVYFIMEITSGVTLGLCIKKFITTLNTWQWHISEILLGILCANFSTSLWITSGYMALYLDFAEIAFGLMLLGVSTRSRASLLLFFAAGIVAAFIIPVKITAICAIILLALASILLSKKSSSPIHICMGIIAGLIVWFLWFQPISDYWDTFKKLFTVTVESGEDDYGLLFLTNWLQNAFIWHFELLIIGVSIIQMWRWSHIQKKPVYLIIGITIAFSLYLVSSGWFPMKGLKPTTPSRLFWLLAILYILSNFHWEKANILAIIFALLPVSLTFGTYNTYAYTTQNLSFVVLAAIVTTRNKLQKWLLISTFFLVLALSLYRIKGKDWFGNRYLSQTIPLSSIGINQNIKVSSYDLELYRTVKEYSSSGDECIVDMFSWGFVPVLGLNPLSSDFRVNTYTAKKAIDESLAQDKRLMCLLYDCECEFGNKSELINYADSLGCEIIHFGYKDERTIIRVNY